MRSRLAPKPMRRMEVNLSEYYGFGSPPSKFLETLEKGSDYYDVEKTQHGFLIRAKEGREAEFDALAEQVMNHPDSFTAFGEPNGRGGYCAVSVQQDE